MNRRVLQRFRKKVSFSDNCWEWIGAKTSAGYGQLNVNGIIVYAHRLSYEHYVGTIPNGYFVCHSCDNPTCVNPLHLFAGTSQDNSRDMAVKKRQVFQKHPERAAHGESHIFSKLSSLEVRNIRLIYDSGKTQQKIAHMFGISQSQVSNIIRGVQRKHG